MAHAFPSGIWEVDTFAHFLSCKEFYNLSITRKGWHGFLSKLWVVEPVKQLVQAMEASLPDLKAVLIDRQLTTAECDTPSKQIHQLWIMMAFLQHSSVAGIWGPALAASPGIMQDLTVSINIPELPLELKHCLLQQAQAQPASTRLQINHQQLVTAAHMKVSKVEGWVSIQCSLGILTDIPDILCRICCGLITEEHLVSQNSQQRPIDYGSQ